MRSEDAAGATARLGDIVRARGRGRGSNVHLVVLMGFLLGIAVLAAQHTGYGLHTGRPALLGRLAEAGAESRPRQTAISGVRSDVLEFGT